MTEAFGKYWAALPQEQKDRVNHQFMVTLYGGPLVYQRIQDLKARVAELEAENEQLRQGYRSSPTSRTDDRTPGTE